MPDLVKTTIYFDRKSGEACIGESEIIQKDVMTYDEYLNELIMFFGGIDTIIQGVIEAQENIQE
ncbi:MAG: hypothetical protein K0S71_634 [Clostridia bacterium]|jgi:hypothetical protein|nr:hypothetical protein [Clostridia bacterium]